MERLFHESVILKLYFSRDPWMETWTRSGLRFDGSSTTETLDSDISEDLYRLNVELAQPEKATQPEETKSHMAGDEKNYGRSRLSGGVGSDFLLLLPSSTSLTDKPLGAVDMYGRFVLFSL